MANRTDYGNIKAEYEGVTLIDCEHRAGSRKNWKCSLDGDETVFVSGVHVGDGVLETVTQRPRNAEWLQTINTVSTDCTVEPVDGKDMLLCGEGTGTEGLEEKGEPMNPSERGDVEPNFDPDEDL